MEACFRLLGSHTEMHAPRKPCLTFCVAAGQTLAASYPAAVQSLPPAAEQLRARLGGLGGAGEVGLQSLAKVAAGKGGMFWFCFAM